VKRVESALRKKSCILPVRSGLKGVAEEIEGNVRVDGSGTWSAAEALIRQPAPASAIVGKGEMWCAARRITEFAWEAGCVCREIGESDGSATSGHNGTALSEMLKRIGEAHSLVHNELREDVGGKDLCKRAEPQQRILSRRLP